MCDVVSDDDGDGEIDEDLALSPRGMDGSFGSTIDKCKESSSLHHLYHVSNFTDPGRLRVCVLADIASL